MKTSIKIKKFWYSDVASDGGLGTGWKEIQIGQREASVKFVGSDASVTSYKNTNGGVLDSSHTKGEMTINFQFADLTPELIAEFTGGTVSSDANADSYDAPLNANQNIEKSIKFLTEKNILYRMPRVSFDAYPSITDDDLHFYQMNGTVLQPEKDLLSSYGYDVLKAPALIATDIIAFSLPEQSGAATISTVAHTVAITVVSGTSKSALVPAIECSPGASVSPETGDTVNFTSPVTFTVTAIDGTTQAWTVTVTVAT